ncbi:MAG: hypothetical protein Q8N81_00820 [bacterium]|nr:hypothetical protein [bacterium]
MKKGILDTRDNQKVLYVFCRQPSRYFSGSELALRVKLSENRIKKMLVGFSKQKIVKFFEKKQQRFFQINRDAAVFSDLVQVLATGKYSDREVVENVLRSVPGLKLAVLTGVFAGLPRSDADLLLVGEASPKQIDKLIAKLEKITKAELNYALMSEREYRDRLYSFDWFIKEIMERNPAVVVDKINKAKKTKSRPHLTAVFTNFKR